MDTVFRNLENKDITIQIKKSLIDYVNVKNEAELVDLLKENKIDYDKIILKMKYERLWNQLIFSKFNSLVKIDKTKLSQQLKKKYQVIKSMSIIYQSYYLKLIKMKN